MGILIYQWLVKVGSQEKGKEFLHCLWGGGGGGGVGF
jgi:hypothetical protein